MALSITYPEFVTNADWCNWTAEHLPDGKDFWVSDVDQYRFDSRGNMALIERKCFNAEMSYCQDVSYQCLDHSIKAGIESTGGVVEVNGQQWSINYHGFFLVQFSGAEFWESSIKLNGHALDRCTVIEQLSFGDLFPDGQRHWEMTINDINVFRNRAGDLLLVERVDEPRTSLTLSVKVLDQLLRAGFQKQVEIKYNGNTYRQQMRYQGAHLLEFIDGQPVRWDGERIDSEKLAKILSFGA